MPYVPGLPAEEPGPLSRFLPPIEHGTVSAWLTEHAAASSWVLDPFGFSPRLPVEAARAGYRVLVTVNNPITRFLLELSADPPAEADFKAALAELAASKRGDERLETHLQSLYLTRCGQCGREIQATAFIWKEGADAPFARVYECRECGDRGQKELSGEDVDRARRQGAADALHRSRALERVAAKDDPERSHVQEALQHYLPRPLYVLTTLINRIESLGLSPVRERALTAAALLACDAGNTMWSPREQTPRPKQLFTPAEFIERNLWMVMEGAHQLWSEAGEGVEHTVWPDKLSGAAGLVIYEGRLKDLAAQVRKEIPIAAVIASVPRPNQAFWTLSALWAGWLWGRAAVEPYRMALRRRRYDWGWNATALHAAFTRLSEILALGTPFFGLVPEVESQFILSAMTAVSGAGFDLNGIALRTPDDPVQFLWARGERLKREVRAPELASLRQAMHDHLEQRGEPAGFLHLKTAALEVLARAHALHTEGQELEAAVRDTRATLETALGGGDTFTHYSTGESIESGTWGLRDWPPVQSLTDRVEVLTVNYLQKHPNCSQLDVERLLCPELPGLFTPSSRTVVAVLNSYAEKQGSIWSLRPEDRASTRQEELRSIASIIERTGARLNYKIRRDGRWLCWEERGSLITAFNIFASALVGPAVMENRFPPERCVLVVPGGRLGLIDYKTALHPALAERLKDYRWQRFRLWRQLADVKILTRETLAEQLASDPVDRAQGQMMMF